MITSIKVYEIKKQAEACVYQWKINENYVDIIQNLA